MAMATEPSASAVAKSSTGSLLPGLAFALLSAFLLDLPFPIAGPMPPWRAAFGWIALVPLLFALLYDRNARHAKYLKRSALIGYVFGIGWYILNCYWIYRTMNLYG